MRCMKKRKVVIGLLGVLGASFAIHFVLIHESALLTHPKGIMARKELNLIVKDILLMLTIIVPTFAALFLVTWKYRSNNVKAEYDPEHSHGTLGEVLLWIVPSIVIAGMSWVLWEAAHDLDPYKPLPSDKEPMKIQVVAIDWKWLFIYPEQGIATLNHVQFPAETPIHFELAADGSPMNSFWIPQLSGQIYSMAGMITQIHMMADGPDVYTGRAAEINGDGYADMTFSVKSTSTDDFKEWVKEVKEGPQKLTDQVYAELLKPTKGLPIALYAAVEKDLFNKIVMKYMQPPKDTLWKTSLEN